MTDADLFREAFRRHAATVVVVTYQDRDGLPSGMTATSMCSLSPTPPSLFVCINREAKAHTAIIGGGRFGVDLLSIGQKPIADHCSRVGTRKNLREAWLADDASTRTPRLRDSLAHLECDVATSYVVYSHTLFVGLIRSVWLNPRDAPPLVYHGGVYGQLESAVERAERFHWELREE